MRTFFRIVLLALVLIVVALISAITAMTFAIHGREVSVPDFVGTTPAEARSVAEQSGLAMDVERQYYSATVARGRILSQSPAARAKVRRGWQVQVAESLGPQRVQIPDVMGQSERVAEINLRRRGLEISSIAQIAVSSSSPADQVLSQDPLPNANDVSSPKIGLLVSDSQQPQAFVTPSFIGQSLNTARAAVQAAGLHLGEVSTVTAQASSQLPASPSANPPPASGGAAPASPASGIVISQDPPSGQKVIAGAAINFVVR